MSEPNNVENNPFHPFMRKRDLDLARELLRTVAMEGDPAAVMKALYACRRPLPEDDDPFFKIYKPHP